MLKPGWVAPQATKYYFTVPEQIFTTILFREQWPSASHTMQPLLHFYVPILLPDKKRSKSETATTAKQSKELHFQMLVKNHLFSVLTADFA